MSTVWDNLWILWVAGFFAIEIPAVIHEHKHGSGATLSAHLRKWFSLQKLDGPFPHLRRIMALAIIIWLPMHLIWGYA